MNGISRNILVLLVLSQLVFIVASIILFKSTDTATSLVILNILLFAILLFLGIKFSKNSNSGIENFKKQLMYLKDFIFLKTNYLHKVDLKGDDSDVYIKAIQENVEIFDKAKKEDMKVLGETILILSKLQLGISKCRIKSSTDNFMIKALKESTNKMLDELDDNMTKIKSITTSYTNDDFTEKIMISRQTQGKLREVVEGINKLGDALANSAKENLIHGEKIRKDSVTMSHAMDELTHKANEQAASLEQTSAAVEEITSLTRNNANSARELSSLGSSVRNSLSEGVSLASKTTNAMDEINTKVTAINEAITVIDQIAFQTNILSLNAAVEAATAGEAGKGFAVVAGEVRNLANRSAEAAKEIKELVEDANIKANSGKQISDEMIQGYKNLDEQIEKTLQIIGDVTSSSNEQMQGIEQINDAVNLLDKVTQQNALEAGTVNKISQELAVLAEELEEIASQKKF